MHSRQLHASLHAFALQASSTLAGQVAGGDEIGFEVVEEGARGSRPGLFCYAPLTGEFLERHWQLLAALPAAADAQLALASLAGLEEYLDTYAEGPRGDVPIAADALRCFARRAFEGCGEGFELVADRFEAAYRELRPPTEEVGEFVVLALLQGLGCLSPQVELSDGVMLAPLGELDVLPPDPLWRRHGVPATVVALVVPRSSGGIEQALGALRDLQTALRLYAPGIAFARLAWIRSQPSGWRPLPLPGGGRGDAHLFIAAEQEDELRAFANLVTRRRPAEGELAWALERFELGLDRDDPLSGLTDNLLALRALLEPEGPRSGRLAGRIAALCAQPLARAEATERVAHAISLEQSLVAGVNVGGDAVALAGEIEQHLRALLRDVICGHLAPDLLSLADSLLAEPAQAQEAPLEPLIVQQPLEPGDWFDAAYAHDDYCATEGEPGALDPGERSR